MRARRVLITDLVDDVLINGLEKAGFVVDYKKDITQHEVNNIIDNYTGIVITTKIGLTADVINSTSLLKWIARAGSGIDHVNVQAAEERNIAIICSPQGNAGSVGEHCVALLLSMLRTIPQAVAATKAFEWDTDAFRVHELAGMTIGIIGYGHTGPAFAKRLQGFDVNVLAYDKYKTSFADTHAQFASLDQVFEQADVFSIHLPLTAETDGMIDSDFINRFKKNILLINTSRGNIMPVQVLLDGLNNEKITFAAIDVLDNEMFEMHNVDEKHLYSRLLQHPRLIATPHVAGKSSSTRRRHADVLLAKILIHSGL